jgi:hypothetical protein
MPMTFADVFDGLLIFKSGLSSDKRCYLCSRILDESIKVEKLPPQYQICCACRRTIKTFAKEGITYSDIIASMDRAIRKLISGESNIKNYTKTELLILGLFPHTPNHSKVDESNKLKEKLTSFFINLN